MTTSNRLSIQDIERIIQFDDYQTGYGLMLGEQLIDTMRENERLREALESIFIATKNIKGDYSIHILVKESLKPNKHLETTWPHTKDFDRFVTEGLSSNVYSEQPTQNTGEK